MSDVSYSARSTLYTIEINRSPLSNQFKNQPSYNPYGNFEQNY